MAEKFQRQLKHVIEFGFWNYLIEICNYNAGILIINNYLIIYITKT